MSESSVVFVCQYFQKESTAICSHWSCPTCTLSSADFYPKCNSSGNRTDCSSYNALGPTSICILPNPTSHSCSRATGKKWSCSDITGYNLGACDGSGTNPECSGYTPQHMAFGPIVYSSDGSSGVFDVPLNYKLLNIRAFISPCSYWKGAPEYFVAENSAVTGPAAAYCSSGGKVFKMLSIAFNCEKGDTSQYAVHSRLQLPCNGASTACPYYTGVCWKYCVDDRLLPGNKVYAEQILELRYYLKAPKWTRSLYEASFPNPLFYPWAGRFVDIPDSIDAVESEILVVETSITLPEIEGTQLIPFEDILVRTKKTVSPGTKVVGGVPDYPDLVEYNSLFSIFSPQVQVRYEIYSDGSGSSSIKYIETNKDISASVAIYGKYYTGASSLYCIDIHNYISNFGNFGIFSEFGDYMLFYIYLVNTLGNSDKIAAAVEEFNSEVERIVLNSSLYQGTSSLVYSNAFDPVSDPATRSAFWFNINTSPGPVSLLILQKVGNSWTYTIDNFILSFVGGILYQTSFARTSQDQETVSYLPDYAKSIGTDTYSANFSLSTITNNIIPPGEPLYYYNDFMGIEAVIPGDYSDRYNYSGHNRLIARKSFTCESSFITQIGSSRYYIVDIPDLLLTDAITPWVVEKVYFIVESEEFEAEFVKCGLSAGIAPNHALIKLKNDGFSLCKEVQVVFENVECVVKSTYSDTVESLYLAAEWELMSCYRDQELYSNWESKLWTNANKLSAKYQIKDSGNISGNSTNVSCTGFKTTLALSCLIRGFSGKISGHTKTKALLWIKQPFCPDIEIIYAHKAPATRYWNYPSCFCWTDAPATNPFYKRDVNYKEIPTNKSESLNYPPCGDHAGNWQWYPYMQCASFNQYAAGSNNAYSSRGEVKGAYNLHGHGLHDIRMEGPDTYSTFVSHYCPPWNCFCTQITGNWHIDSSNAVWAGKARIQGEISDNTLVRWLETGASYGTSVLPKFGNVLRSFMRSYRATDRVEYKVATLYGTYERESRWLPAPSDYDDVGVYQTRSEFHNTNTTSEGPYPINQLGLLLFNLESGVSSPNETYTGIRLRHEEVFSRFQMGSVVYPLANFAYSDGNVGYEFKPLGQNNIQWAWRELQKPVVRSKDSLTNISFIKVEYPYYMLDMNRFEHRLGIDEGEATITFIPPTFDPQTGTLVDPPALQLGSGPKRFFDYAGNFDLETVGESLTQAQLYKESTSGEWLSASTLFSEPDASSNTSIADEDARKIRLYIEPTATVITRYYNRGLYVTFGNLINTVTTNKGLNYTDLELQVAQLGKKSLASILSELPRCTPSEDLAEPVYFSSMFDSVVSLSCGNLYTCNQPGVLGFNVTVVFDSPVLVRGVILEFKTGKQKVSVVSSEASCHKQEATIIYDTPFVEIPKSQRDQELNGTVSGYSNVVTSRYGFGDISSGSNTGYAQCRLERDLYFKDFFSQGMSFSFYINLAPDPEVISANYKDPKYYFLGYAEDSLNIHRVVCTSIKLITSTLNPVIEPINVYERKYLVSIGGAASESVASRMYDEESILDTRKSENTSLVSQADDDSTVWLREINGITVGHETESPGKGTATKKVYASKTRTRFVGEYFGKAEPIKGEPEYLETRQKKMFDAIFDQGGDYLTASTLIPPNTKSYLESNNLNLDGVPGGCNFNVSNTIRPIGTVVSYPTFHSEGYKIEPGKPYVRSWLGTCWDYSLVNKDTGAVMYGGGALAQLSYFAWGAMATVWKYQSFRSYSRLFIDQGGSESKEPFAEKNVTSLGSIDKIRCFIHQSGSNYSLAQYYQYTYWGNYEMVQRMSIGPGWQTLWGGTSAAVAAYAMGYDVGNY